MNPIRAKLLIVDHNEAIRSGIRLLMNDLGIVKIDEASDCGAALALVRNNHYDLVLCEWSSAPFSGIEVVRWVRHAPVANDTPVVLLSDDGSASRTVEALEAGANGLLAKPFSTSRLCDKVKRIIASHAPVSETGPANRASRADTWTPLH